MWQEERMNVSKLIRSREASGGKVSEAITSERRKTLDLSSSRIISDVSSFSGKGITLIDLDPVEQRYLMAGSVDGTVCAFDVLSHYYTEEKAVDQYCSHTTTLQNRKASVHQHLFRLEGTQGRLPPTREREEGHKGAVTGLQWYPVDSGLFVSSSKDCNVRLFDANELSMVCSVQLEFQINCVSMSTIALAHSLVAVASRNPVIRLWDPRNDCISLSFAGHIGKEVTALAWSSNSEWLLISGGSDGQIRIWDVRKANCLLSLDQYNTKTYSEALLPLPDLDHLRRKRLKTPQTDDVLYRNFNRNLQNWVNSKKLVQKFSVARQNETVTAHDSPVKFMLSSSDGLFLYSAASKMMDMHKWDLSSGKNMLVHYELPASASKCLKIDSSSNGQSLFVPHRNSVYHLDSLTGKRLAKLTGHYDSVTSCVHNNICCEMYTASLDGNILVWEPELLRSQSKAFGTEARDDGVAVDLNNEDDWTTDEENM